jgi:hypothetical protein
MSGMIIARTKLVSALLAGGFLVAVAMMLLAAGLAPVEAQVTPPCDFLTGGGWIVHSGSQANFAVGGGCKQGSPTWGHLEYTDHGINLKVHGTGITAYIFIDQGTGVDPKTHQPTGTREICGTASTNLYGDVDFAVKAEDLGEPGVNDHFDIRLTDGLGNPFYDTTTECQPHFLGSSAPCAPGGGGGGNVQLHKPNPSNTGNFGGSCPAAFGGIIVF